MKLFWRSLMLVLAASALIAAQEKKADKSPSGTVVTKKHVDTEVQPAPKTVKVTPEIIKDAQKKLLDGSGYRKLKDVIGAQGGNPQVLDRFDLLPNATGAREITSPRAGYISAIDAELIDRGYGRIDVAAVNADKAKAELV